MSVGNSKPLDEITNEIRRQRDQEVSLRDVVRLAEISTEAFQAFFAAMDSAVLRELREIAEYITAMKREIGSLQVNDIRNAHIPAAGQELDAIVRATEAATNTIMECAEAAMASASASPEAHRQLVEEKMMIIFEACSFQDITGQRIAKVVDTLQHIERRVTRFAEAVKVGDFAGAMSEEEIRAAERRARLLLHGPPTDGGNDQREVDALMRPEKSSGNSQSDIDRLFARG